MKGFWKLTNFYLFCRSTLKPEIKKCIGDIMHPFSTWLHTKHSQDRAGKFVQVLMDVMNFLQDLSKQHPEWNPEKLQSTPVLVDSLQKSMTTNHQAERTRDQLGSLLQLMDFLRGEKLKTSFVDARGQKASLRGLANVTSNKPVTSAAEDAQPKSNSKFYIICSKCRLCDRNALQNCTVCSFSFFSSQKFIPKPVLKM